MKLLISLLCVIAINIPAFAQIENSFPAPPNDLFTLSMRDRIKTWVPAYPDQKIQDYVQALGEKLLVKAPSANIDFEFMVSDDPDVYGLSIEDGFIIVSRGLIYHMNSEAQLSYVLGHEIGHVLSRHQQKDRERRRKAFELEMRLRERFESERADELFGTLSEASLKGYSREQEVEADTWGERLLKDNGYMTVESINMLKFAAQLEEFTERHGWPNTVNDTDQEYENGIFATHPSPLDRVDIAKKRQRRAGRKEAPLDKDFLERINGMVFGLAVKDGIQRNNVFVNGEKNIAFHVPENWFVATEDENILISSLNQKIIFLITRMDSGGLSPKEQLERSQRYETAPYEHSDIEINSNIALGIISYPNSTKALTGAINIKDQNFLFGGIVREGSFESQLNTFESIIASLRFPTQTEREFEPLRIHIETVGDHFIPSSEFIGDDYANIQLLNQQYPEGVFENGDLIKTIK